MIKNNPNSYHYNKRRPTHCGTGDQPVWGGEHEGFSGGLEIV